MHVDCKTVRISAYSSTRDPRAVKRKVWNEAENRERDWGETLALHAPYGSLTGVGGLRASRLRLLRHALPIFLLIFRKKPTVLQSIMHASPFFLLACKTCICKNICSAHTRVYIPSRRPFILLTQIKYLIILSA